MIEGSFWNFSTIEYTVVQQFPFSFLPWWFHLKLKVNFVVNIFYVAFQAAEVWKNFSTEIAFDRQIPYRPPHHVRRFESTIVCSNVVFVFVVSIFHVAFQAAESWKKFSTEIAFKFTVDVVCVRVALEALLIISHIRTVHVFTSEMYNSFVFWFNVPFQNVGICRFEQTVFKWAFFELFRLLFFIRVFFFFVSA